MQINNLNRCISPSELETDIKNLPTKNIQGQIVLGEKYTKLSNQS